MSRTRTESRRTTTHTSISLSTVAPTTAQDQPSRHANESDPQIPPNAIEAIPNGGYGWTVVFGCSLLTFWVSGWTGAWGVLQTALLKTQLTGVSTSTISFVGSLALALCVALGLVSVRLSRAIGARYSAVIGIVFVSMGILLSSFTTDNIGGIFVTAGALVGIGFGLLYSMANSVPVQWFSTRLGTANGLVKLGGGLGSTVLSLANQVLIDRVGVAWTFRTLGLLCLATGVPAALLIRERVPPSTGRVLDLSLFKNLVFVCLFLAGAIGTFALFVPPFFLPLFAQSIGLSPTTGAGIVAGFNACTAVGRFGVGPACDRYGPTNMLLLAMCMNAVSMLAIWPISSTIGPLVVFAAINGIANGAFFVAMPTSIASMIGLGDASVAMSMATTGWTGGYLMGSPIAGILIAATGANEASSIVPYRAAIFYAGGVAFASGVFVLIARLRMDPNLKKKL